ncbi:YegP family protein [Phytohabitans aurantiacus]|uniref:DUF1508 domain-containing protein n=1 Tax=Phytohabitans aurantiacus TaxID=3016789 RepID=A0ABQ5R1R4_9ACTN|nr:YegP family protein [Phytohabitans aurantiacus]GLI00676.1 hypothetical protein Pa4123_59520 [Phytohabitans aurantiacus]
MQFHINKATNGQFYWKIVASNGQTLATSETYWNKSDAESACRSVKANAASAPIVDNTVAAYRR